MDLGPSKIGAVILSALLGVSVFMGGGGGYAYAQNPSDDFDAQNRADEILSKMCLEEKIGQMFMLDFRKKDRRDVTTVDKSIATIIQRYQPGGVILFRENSVSTIQTLELTRGYKKASPKIPLFIAVDQEGGAVTRLQSGTVMPGNMALGAVGNLKLTYAVARAIGEELQALGINMNFAPVIDVNNNPSNPVIGVRSFGDNPVAVAGLGIEFMNGLQDAGIITAAKHFPGHGDTAMDSHIDLPTVSHGFDRLEAVEFVPFKALINNGIDMIMTAHVTFPAIEGRDGVPATLSYNCLTDLLRDRMGFKGIVITDAFSMKAITDRYGDKEAASMAIKAGADIVLMPQNIEDTFSYILEQVRNGEISEARIDSSVRRILALKIKGGIIGKKAKFSLRGNRRALKTVGGEKNAFIRRTVAERAVTLVKNENAYLPFRLEMHHKIVFFAPSQIGTDQVMLALQELLEQVGVKTIGVRGFNYDGQRAMTSEQKEAVQNSDFILLFTRTMKDADLSPVSSFMPDFSTDLLTNAQSFGKKIAAISVRNPYDIQFLPGVTSYLAVYSDWAGGGVEAAIKVIFGKNNPTGKLPVSITDRLGNVIYPTGHGLSFALEHVKDMDDQEWSYLSLKELWANGVMNDVGSYRPDGPVDGRMLDDLLRRMLLITHGQALENVSFQGELSRYRMIQWFQKAARIAGLNPSTVNGFFANYRSRADRCTQDEMVVAAVKLLRLLQTSKTWAGGSNP